MEYCGRNRMQCWWFGFVMHQSVINNVYVFSDYQKYRARTQCGGASMWCATKRVTSFNLTIAISPWSRWPVFSSASKQNKVSIVLQYLPPTRKDKLILKFMRNKHQHLQWKLVAWFVWFLFWLSRHLFLFFHICWQVGSDHLTQFLSSTHMLQLCRGTLDSVTVSLFVFYRTRVRSLVMLVSDWLTHSLLFSKLDWCDPGVWRYQLKTCWYCYCC